MRKVVNLDSILLEIDRRCIKSWDKDAFMRAKIEAPDGKLLRTTYKLYDNNIIGLKDIKIKEDKATIDLSSKILQDRYFDLINKNTIEQVAFRLNETKVIKLDKNKFIDSAQLLRCDVTNNLKVGDVSDYVREFKKYAFNKNYFATAYRYSGLVFKKKVMSYKERVIMYDKYLELLSDANMLRLVNKDEFKNVLRIESNITSFKRMREAFDVGRIIKLKDVLSSPAKVNYNKLRSVYTFDLKDEEIKQNLDFLYSLKDDSGQDMKLYKIEKMLGRLGIINMCGQDIETITEFIRAKVSGNVSNYIKQYRELFKLMADRDSPQGYPDKIEQVFEMLKAA